ncbi:hypothetical protein [Saccharicrinis sp. FJH54]|uniref:hypothetical protein n=1 Tax=Saccharicrinis sp. FJH54 TaxID=3344665 RepID=UPI0035D3EC9A
MKIQNLIFLIVVFILASGCKRNKLKTDEKSLAQTIRTEEEQLAYEQQLKEEHEKQLADSLAKLPKGFRFKEDRSVDPRIPPKIIDIAGNLHNFKSFKLSDFASEIEYVRIEQPDSSFHPQMKFHYLMLDNYIVASNLYGIVLYSKQGELISNVISNKITGVHYNPEKSVVTSSGTGTHIGSGSSLWHEGNKLYYTYVNSYTGQRYIMGLDCNNLPVTTPSGFNPEKSGSIIGLGKVELDLNHGRIPPMGSKKNTSTDLLDFRSMVNSMRTFALNKNTYFYPLRGKNMLAIFNSRGDTLATFTKYEQVKNYTKTLTRGVDRGFHYQKNGKHYLRTDYNDTVFQILPPNRLLPVYVFNLGKHKIDKQQGIDPGVSLEGKIIPNGFAEFNNHIFIEFLKDNYDCSNNRKNKLVKQYYGVFNIFTYKFELVQADSLDYSANILENDIDGGFPVWPTTYNSDNGNEMLIPLFGWELKQHIKSNNFINSNAPEGKKAVLKKLSEAVADNDRILVVIK